MTSFGTIEKIASFIKTHLPKCNLVGVSDEQEIFVEFEEDNQEQAKQTKAMLLQAFPECKDVVAVIRPSIQTLNEMVEALNSYLDEDRSKKSPLLQIEDL